MTPVAVSAQPGSSASGAEEPETIITQQLMDTISSWAGAWQSQLPDLFVTHYVLDYKPAGYASHEAWVKSRRERLTDPDYIKLRLLDFELISLSDTTATTRFTLIYERPGYSDRTYKELVLTGQNGFWLISKESNLDVSPL